MSRRKICVVTGARSEYGLLAPVMAAILDSADFTLQVAATGAHLSPEFGRTVDVLVADGFVPDERVEMLLSSDTALGMATSLGLGVMGLAGAFERLAPDLVFLLGDRYETLAAGLAAATLGLPLAHCAGGDLTLGAVDDVYRHCLTKMAHAHFPTNADAAARIRQMGEDPARIHLVGSPGLDALRTTPRLSRDELARELDFAWREKNLLVTFHPETLERRPSTELFAELLAALEALGPDLGLIFTLPGADAQGRALIAMTEDFCASRPQAKAYTSLGQKRYLSAAALVDAVVGNSSSGLYEVPSLGTATVNIGDRQKGRPQAASVVSCPHERGAILEAVRRAMALDCSGVVNPYGDGRSAARIVAALEAIPDFKALSPKTFHPLEGA
ncbi:MAG: UDP-N-acetylglucosamine 2-epimerase [Desulfovibrionaceae bacterium]